MSRKEEEKFNKRNRQSRIYVIAILLLLSIVIYFWQNSIKIMPDYDKYDFSIGGGFTWEKDVINFLTFRYNFGTQKGHISFVLDPLTKIKFVNFDLPPSLELENCSVFNDTHHLNVSIKDKSNEISSRYFLKFSEPLKNGTKFKIDFVGAIYPNGDYRFQPVTKHTYGWSFSMNLGNYKCDYSCIGYHPEYVKVVERGNEISITTEENTRGIYFVINSYDGVKAFWKNLLSRIFTGLIVAIIVQGTLLFSQRK